MRSNLIGIRISLFCITFLCGLLMVERFFVCDKKLISNEIERKPFLKMNKDSEKVEFEQSPAKSPCDEYFDLSKYNDLQKEEVRFTKQLVDEIESSQDEKSTRRKLKTLEREVKSLAEYRNKLRSKEREQRGVHNLLFVVDCAEYNEPR